MEKLPDLGELPEFTFLDVLKLVFWGSFGLFILGLLAYVILTGR